MLSIACRSPCLVTAQALAYERKLHSAESKMNQCNDTMHKMDETEEIAKEMSAPLPRGGSFITSLNLTFYEHSVLVIFDLKWPHCFTLYK